MTGKAYIYLMITLLVGFALGLLTDGLQHAIKMNKRENRAPMFMVERIIMEDLQLTPEQRKQVEPVIREFEKKSVLTREMIRKQVESDLDSLKLSLTPYLSADQLKKFDSLMKPDKRPGPPPPGPGNRRPPGMEPPPGGNKPPPNEMNPPPDGRNQVPPDHLSEDDPGG